ANTLTRSVQSNSPHSSQPIQFINTTDIQLGNSQLGRGALAVTAQTGNITTAGGGQITQEQGAAAATFTVTNGTSIILDGSNDFTGPLVFGGLGGFSTLDLRNTDPLATLANVTVPHSVTDLTVTFDNAPLV